ncbi:6-phosphofructokinase [Pseudoramibacter sp.]|jgi:6-phosphofructokinase 1|uniref:6-phosphofructokinase n=1 Tax=Pseudoramibacter sp. TaxID=2034862 RepID=UPI0025DBED6D|nr:6-phosphofructokinase [Pseudoramibacter sp.]MCH4073027.1 6-phosphofructokinase [Pseudoramibacter sp.]MCH4106798.1 6-phosphofructokinase [Pseudoramibacter sp.]
MKRIGLLTSGGDAPGMNAAIRAVVRTAIYHGYEVYGINRGYAGLLEQDFYPMNSRSVANIIDHGGTILQTSRSDFFPTNAGLHRAAEILKEYDIDVLVVIGGDGSLTGALKLQNLGVKIVGIPGTIDNDFGASDYTIGFDTAVSTAIDAISKIRDTTFSHNRINVVQVMGRRCGDIAMYAGLACGAKGMIIPEKEVPLETLCQRLVEGRDRGKMHSIIMLAEGCGGYRDYCKKIQELTKVETKGTNLGYIQRGGSPSHFDRNLASNMGYMAVEEIVKGHTGIVIVTRNGKYEAIDLEEALNTPKTFDEEMYKMIQILSM